MSHLMARGNLEHLPIHEGSCAVIPCPRGLPGETTRKTDWLTRHERKRDSDGALFWREHGMSVQKKKKSNMIRRLTKYQILGKTQQRFLRRKVEYDKYAILSKNHTQIFNERNLCTSELDKVTHANLDMSTFLAERSRKYT